MKTVDLIKLNRYTTLPVLLDLLKRKRLVLLDPESWEDRNDSGVLREYKRRKKLLRLFAICFSYGDETIHQWKAFADGISGCCIEFDAQKLITQLKEIDGVRYRCVRYRKIGELDDGAITVNDMPFYKRWPYRCEDEFRVIWEGESKETFFEIEIDLSTINRITINQKMPQQVYTTIRDSLRGAFANPDQRIIRSTLYESKQWLQKFRRC
jgi:hypothetical protein